MMSMYYPKAELFRGDELDEYGRPIKGELVEIRMLIVPSAKRIRGKDGVEEITLTARGLTNSDIRLHDIVKQDGREYKVESITPFPFSSDKEVGLV
ncbi:hypothetical protein [Brevibacillus brevis]|uniref:hypothetical protein n=1 Tax=Brevibacillus brevis TaxID=1393 RepID=UPI000D0F815E|nr:hypothetical protein [Brevibacillus brevis]PSJ67450.1 hypothetical protein C7J99_20885 [Brevibacillus brevis]RED28436.1 hypothetical protein DES34_108303 [Brevibacillus brevis]GEC90690.1 hypothetical protein BBR01nite_30210 [Brevibacillus brevis]VEF91131.1 Uncharacterised protein [Brevibacillus brevis]